MKACTKCKEQKDLSFFGPAYNTRDGRQSWCRACTSVASVAWYKTPEGRRTRFYTNIKTLYGLLPAEFDELICSQDGVCVGCLEPLLDHHVDHDHITGEVRGILCRGCNHAIGNAQDDPEILQRLIEYLMMSKTK